MYKKVIIAIHSVSENTLSPYRLERYLNIMRILGYKFVSIDQILSSTVENSRMIALTVDDAYKSCITNLMPILQKYNIPALMFVPTGLLELSANDKNLIKNECYKNEATMSMDDVNHWLKNGFSIGFHCHNHLDLYNATNIQEIETDFKAGMKVLKDNHWDSSYFAYPKGFLPKNRIHFHNLLIKNNFTHAFTINWGEVNTEEVFLYK